MRALQEAVDKYKDSTGSGQKKPVDKPVQEDDDPEAEVVVSGTDIYKDYGVGLGNDEGDTVLRCASVDALGIPYIRIAPTCIYSCDYLCRVLNFCHIIGPPLFVLWYKSTESFRALHFHDSYVNSQSTLSGYLLISVVVSNA